MSRFNQSTKTVKSSKTVNAEGAEAYTLTPKLELYSLACTFLGQDKFYEKADKQLKRLVELIKKNDPEFVAKLAVYVREKMYLRTLPLVLSVELAKVHSGDNLVSRAVERVIQRVDELTEILAYYQFSNNRKDVKKLSKLSKQIRLGIANAFNKFDSYQFSKYNRDNEIKLKDALFISHPFPKDNKQENIFKKIVDDTLEVPYTWEVELSRLGQQKFDTEEAKAEAVSKKWEELIASNKLGYMATLRNLRNILDAKVSTIYIEKVCQYLSNAKAVRNSKQLPFRFFSAYRELEGNASKHTDKILFALEEAVKISIENIPTLNGDVLIACDVSGSMQTPISAKSKVERYDIGLLLGQLLRLKCENNILGIFGDTFKVKRTTSKELLSNTMRLHDIEGEVGYSTNGYLVIDWLIKNKVVMDKVIMFTDCQMWDSRYGNTQNFADYWRTYKQIAPKAKLILFDMAGYGNTPIDTKTNDVYLIAGWSDKIFDMIEAYENKESAVKEIEAMEI
jgi:hypothetical protein